MSDITKMALLASDKALREANDTLLAFGDRDGAHIIRARTCAFVLRLGKIDADRTIQWLQQLERTLVPRETDKKPKLATVNGEPVV